MSKRGSTQRGPNDQRSGGFGKGSKRDSQGKQKRRISPERAKFLADREARALDAMSANPAATRRMETLKKSSRSLYREIVHNIDEMDKAQKIGRDRREAQEILREKEAREEKRALAIVRDNPKLLKKLAQLKITAPKAYQGEIGKILAGKR